MLKRVILVFLLSVIICPLTFWGQNRSYKSSAKNNKSQPVTIEKQKYGKKSRSFYCFPYFALNVGPAILNGDNSIRGHKLGGEGNIVLGFQFSKYVGLEGSLGYTVLKGRFSGIVDQETNAFEANINLTFSLANIFFGYEKNRLYDIVPHIGIGQVQHKSTSTNSKNGDVYTFGYDNNNENNMKGNGLNGRRVMGTIPMGIDFVYSLTNDVLLHFDISTIYTDTDRFDAVPSGYHYDWYSTFNLGIEYTFKNKVGKNKNRNRRITCDDVLY